MNMLFKEQYFGDQQGLKFLQFDVANKKQMIDMKFSNYCSRVNRYSFTPENIACLRMSCFLCVKLLMCFFMCFLLTLSTDKLYIGRKDAVLWCVLLSEQRHKTNTA